MDVSFFLLLVPVLAVGCMASRKFVYRSAPGWLILICAACATTPVAITDFDSRYDFSEVRAIAIQPIDRTTPSNVVISDLQIDRINGALAGELRHRGYRVVASATEADMLLAWHLVSDERSDATGFDISLGLGCFNCGTQVGMGVSTGQQQERGSFIVDLLDPVQLRTVWRATLETDLDPGANAEQSEAYRREVAKAIFAQFPPA